MAKVNVTLPFVLKKSNFVKSKIIISEKKKKTCTELNNNLTLDGSLNYFETTIVSIYILYIVFIYKMYKTFWLVLTLIFIFSYIFMPWSLIHVLEVSDFEGLCCFILE